MFLFCCVIVPSDARLGFDKAISNATVDQFEKGNKTKLRSNKKRNRKDMEEEDETKDESEKEEQESESSQQFQPPALQHDSTLPQSQDSTQNNTNQDTMSPPPAKKPKKDKDP